GLKPSRGFVHGSQRCSLATDGEVQCWGRDLCAPSDERAPGALPVPGLPPAIALSGGGGMGCAIDRDNQVWCWGELEARDVCNDGTAQRIAGVDEAIQITTGSACACALSTAGTIRCWGENHWGVLGRPETEIEFSPE